MANGAPGVVGASSGGGDGALPRMSAGTGGAGKGVVASQKGSVTASATQQVQPMSGQGAQFVYAAATVANILCDNLTQTQINLLANFLSVVTTCVFAVLTVENPTELLET